MEGVKRDGGCEEGMEGGEEGMEGVKRGWRV